MRSFVIPALLALALCVPAYGDTITTTAQGNVDAVPKFDQDTTSTFNSPISSTVTWDSTNGASDADFGGPAFATANQNITVLGVLGDVEAEGVFAGSSARNFMSATADQVSTATVAGNHRFSIFVKGAQLRLLDFAGLAVSDPERMVVTYDILATLTQGGVATTLFESNARLEGGDVSHLLTKGGTDLGSTFFSNGFSDFGYDFGSHFQNILLPGLSVGDFVTYTMSVTVDAPSFETGGAAFIRDPQDLNNVATTALIPDTGPSPDPIPEPGSLALVALGVGVLMRRRKRAE